MSHYETLGVSRTADDKEIKSAFRKLAMQWHPDKNPGDAAAEKKFKEINEAYETLKDADKRHMYDLQTEAPRHREQGRSQSYTSWEEAFSRRRQYGNNPNIDEILEELIRQRTANQQQAKNKDINLRYTISFAESFSGKEVELRYSTSKHASKTIKVNIPKSVRDGTKIRYAGMGDDSNSIMPAGDLYVIVSVTPDDRFVRQHDDTIITSVTIDFIEAMLGVNKNVPCVDGTEVKLRIHPGTQANAQIKVPEKGFYNAFGRRGSMLVEVLLEHPKLNSAQYALLAKIKDM